MSLCDISNFEISNERRVQLMDKNEPLLQENDKRFVLFPIKYHDIWTSYKDNLTNFWICGNVRLADSIDALGLGGQLEFLQRIFSFWTTYSEQSFLFQLNNDIQIPEARCFLGYQIYNNANHMELFSVLLRDLPAGGKVDDHKIALVGKLFAHESLGGRVVVYTAMQSVFASSIQLVKTLLAQSSHTEHVAKYIDLVLRDRADYVRFGPVLMRHCVNKPSNEKVRSIVDSFVEIETQFLLGMLEQSPCEGIDTESVVSLVRRQGDLVCELFQSQEQPKMQI